ncbi:MAG: SDR family NAD(P)-dependent oxidoreductase [Pseudomonadota bacterium]
MAKTPNTSNNESSNPGSAADTPTGMGRRAILTGGAIAAAIAAPVALGMGGAAAAQTAENGEASGEFAGKTVFITGGARGIGLATAEAFARGGADIALFDVATRNLSHVQYPLSSEQDLTNAKSTIEALGARCMIFRGDVRSYTSQLNAMQQVVDTVGSLDILVVNAGVSQVGAMEDFSADEISTVYEINVAGAIKTTQAAVQFMKPQNSGRIIYISSALGRMGNELFPVYTSTKWALIGVAKSAALSYGRSNILCNVVAPGLANTPLADNEFILSRMMPGAENPTFQALSEMLAPGNPIPVGHVEPEDVADVVKFFASEGASKITGEVFDVSYGSLARSIA